MRTKSMLVAAVLCPALCAGAAMAEMVNFHPAPYANVGTTTDFGGDGLSSLGYHFIDVLDGGATLSAWGDNGGASLDFSQRVPRPGSLRRRPN